MSAPLLDVSNLGVEFRGEDGSFRVVDRVEFTLESGQLLGIAGESGSGKSVTCLSIMGLLDPRVARISGQIAFRGEDLLTASSRRMRAIRGNEIAMVFQEPMASLNPVKSIGDHLCEAIRLHRRVSRRQARLRARELLEAVGIARADRRMREYAHQFSGGMCQRVMIAMALVNDPALIIADEPTTALDVTTQAQILALLQSLQADFGSAVILVTHDFGVIAETVDDVMIMYAGNVVERGSVKSVFRRPRHPYTWGLIGSIPRSDVTVQRLHQIPGQPPSPLHAPPGCRFHPRCPHAMPICRVDVPELRPSPGEAAHYDACHLADEVKAEEGASLRARLSRRTK